jgi:hypothetical protein
MGVEVTMVGSGNGHPLCSIIMGDLFRLNCIQGMLISDHTNQF